MSTMPCRVAVLVVLCLFAAVPAVSRGQDEKAPPAAEKPAEKPADEPGNDKAPPAEAEDFDALFGELKKLIVELNDIRSQYATAPEAEQPALEKKYKELIERGQVLFPKLVPAAEQAFEAKPDLAGDAGKHLLETVERSVAEGKTKEANRVLAMMLAKVPDNAQLLGISGTLAFNAGDNKTANEQLTKAAAAGKLPEGSKKVLDEIKIREAEAKADDLPRVKFETNQGTMVIELFENEAPNTVANFVSLVEKKFYDGLVFHRVIEGFMAQGGDPTGTGSGGPGHAIPCECDPKKFPNHRNHFRGTLSMAHAGPNTGGSQFFLCFGPTEHLNGKHTAFGRVIEGMEVLDKIKRIQPGEPGTPDKIVKATVVRKRDHEYKPKTLPDPRG
jgi:cyclophilin family peptidyl-prolyl cis-trans isomerase